MTDARDQHIIALRDALQRTIPLLGYAVGREAATAPGYAGELLATVADLEDVLRRTAPSTGP